MSDAVEQLACDLGAENRVTARDGLDGGDEIGGGRKVAIFILEFFDRIGYTRRVRDAHVLRHASADGRQQFFFNP